MKKLVNEDLASTISQITAVNDSFKDVIYGIYKSVFILTRTTSYRGNAADQCKEYMASISLNTLRGYLNVVQEFTDTINDARDAALMFEPDENGIVSTKCIDNVADTIKNTHRAQAESCLGDIEGILSKAASFISVKNISADDLSNSFNGLEDKLDTVEEQLTCLDEYLADNLGGLLEHISALDRMVSSMDKIVDGKNNIDYDKAISIVSDGDFYFESEYELTKMMEDDPFSYYADGGSLYEKQWATGKYKDLYAYGGITAVTGSYYYKNDGGKHEAHAEGSLFEASGGFQATEYLNGTAVVTALHADGTAKFGWSDKYKGFSLEGDASVAKAKGEVKVGSDDFNGYAKGEASVLSASGFAKAEYESSTDWCLGVKGSASAASAKGSLGFSFLEVDVPDESDPEGKKKKNLFGLEATAKAGASTSGALYAESEKVIDTNIVDVNTFTVDVGLEALIGAEVNFTVPYITLW